MATTRWNAVLNAIVSAMRATAGYQSPSTVGNNVIVFDSTETFITSEASEAFLVIGRPSMDADGSVNADETGQSAQNFATLGGNRARDENGTLMCVAVCQTGDNAPASVRARAFQILADVETVIRNDPTIGAVVLWAHITDQKTKLYASGGSVCQIEFEVSYRARL